MSALLEATDLHTFYGASHVLHGVTFSVEPGQTVTLMGRNGMGKTTTIRSVLGLTPPRSGEVRVDGKPVTGWPAHRIAAEGIALVPEGRGIFPTLSVRENLRVAQRPGRWTEERALALFPRLRDRLAHLGSQLSGGEQQMLSIARALLTNPRRHRRPCSAHPPGDLGRRPAASRRGDRGPGRRQGSEKAARARRPAPHPAQGPRRVLGGHGGVPGARRREPGSAAGLNGLRSAMAVPASSTPRHLSFIADCRNFKPGIARTDSRPSGLDSCLLRRFQVHGKSEALGEEEDRGWPEPMRP